MVHLSSKLTRKVLSTETTILSNNSERHQEVEAHSIEITIHSNNSERHHQLRRSSQCPLLSQFLGNTKQLLIHHRVVLSAVLQSWVIHIQDTKCSASASHSFLRNHSGAPSKVMSANVREESSLVTLARQPRAT